LEIGPVLVMKLTAVLLSELLRTRGDLEEELNTKQEKLSALQVGLALAIGLKVDFFIIIFLFFIFISW
jgi:hypothetical protein